MTLKRKVSWLTGLILLIVATAAAQTARSQATTLSGAPNTSTSSPPSFR